MGQADEGATGQADERDDWDEEELWNLRKRLDEVESLSAFQERTLNQLDGVITAFTRRVVRVEGEVRQLTDKLDTLLRGEKQDDFPP
jgi:uncharacterized coiled-coil protein SlyX